MRNKCDSMVLLNVTVTVIVAVMIVVIAFTAVSSILKSVESEMDDVMAQVGEKAISSISDRVKNDLEYIELLADSLTATNTTSKTDVLDVLKSVYQNSRFTRLGYSDLQGNTINTYGDEFSIEEYQEIYSSFKLGESAISNTISNSLYEFRFIIYISPIFEEGNVVGAVYGIESIEEYSKYTEDSTEFTQKGLTLLVDKNGNTFSERHKTDLFEILEGSIPTNENYSIGMAMDDMKNGRSGSGCFIKNGVTRHLSYIPVPNSDWYYVVMMPREEVLPHTSGMVSVIIWSAVWVVFSVLALVVFLMLQISRIKKRLTSLAFYDDITGELNLRGFIKHAETALEKNNTYVIVKTDINKFKLINDLYGYDEGNKMLKMIAKTARRFMGENEILARAESDKFLVLLNYDDDDSVRRRLRAVELSVRKQCMENSENMSKYTFTMYAGVFRATDADVSATVMIDRAGIALATVKGSHSSELAFYSDDMRGEIIEQKMIEDDMHMALREGQFEVYFQPKVRLNNREIVGAEALIRWNHPTRGMISPAEFIPVFERDGFVVKTDEFVFREVCRIQRQWMDSGMKMVPISVNISRLHLYNPGFIQNYREIASDYRIPFDLIELEITESVMFDNKDLFLDMFRKLKNTGFRVSMDDFGSGYSSLNLLRAVPVDVLKLDKGFFAEDGESVRSRAILSSIVDMAHVLEIDVISEGVETEEQVKLLMEIGCEFAQGFLFSRPLSKRNFEVLMTESSSFEVLSKRQFS